MQALSERVGGGQAVGIVVVAGYGDENAAARESYGVCIEQFLRLGRGVARIVHVAGDGHDVYPPAVAEGGDLVQHGALLVDTGHRVQFFSDVPVGGMQNLHTFFEIPLPKSLKFLAVNGIIEYTALLGKRFPARGYEKNVQQTVGRRGHESQNSRG